MNERTTVTLRQAERADLPAILDLIRLPDFNSQALDLVDAEAHFDRIACYPDYRIYLAETQDGKPAGTVTLIVFDNLAHMGMKIALVENVIVAGNMRANGIGRMMMQHVADKATEAGAYKLILATGMRRKHAHAFYESLGFERYGYSFGLPLTPEAAHA